MDRNADKGYYTSRKSEILALSERALSVIANFTQLDFIFLMLF